MYGEFGCCLGTDPDIKDSEINSLRVAVLPLPGGEFYHFGTSHELLSSTLAVQNLETTSAASCIIQGSRIRRCSLAECGNEGG